MDVKITNLRAEYEAFMWDVLYRNIFTGKTNKDLERDMEDLPDLKKYIEDYGQRKGDFGYIALNKENQPIGAVWIRFFNDDYHSWGYIDEQTPEMNIVLEKDYRNGGIGTKLMDTIFENLPKDVKRISISIHPDNRCVSLYKRYGFEQVEYRKPAIVMVKNIESK